MSSDNFMQFQKTKVHDTLLSQKKQQFQATSDIVSKQTCLQIAIYFSEARVVE